MVQPIELSVEIDRPVALPEQANHLERLLEAAHRLTEIESVRNGVFHLSTAEPKDEASLREMVESERCLSEQRGVPAYGVNDLGRDWGSFSQNCCSARDSECIKMPVWRR